MSARTVSTHNELLRCVVDSKTNILWPAGRRNIEYMRVCPSWNVLRGSNALERRMIRDGLRPHYCRGWVGHGLHMAPVRWVNIKNTYPRWEAFLSLSVLGTLSWNPSLSVSGQCIFVYFISFHCINGGCYSVAALRQGAPVRQLTWPKSFRPGWRPGFRSWLTKMSVNFINTATRKQINLCAAKCRP